MNIRAVVLGFSVTLMSLTNSFAAIWDFTLNRGIYVIYNADFSLENRSLATFAQGLLGDADVTGFTLKYKWADLQPFPNTYKFDRVVADVQTAAQNGKKVFLWVQSSTSAPQWIYAAQYNIAALKIMDPSQGQTQFEKSQIALPWDSTYRGLLKDFIKLLADTLRSSLSPGEYKAIVKVNVSNPGGVLDQCGLPTGTDPNTAIDDRVASGYVHDYDKELQTGTYTNGNVITKPDGTPITPYGSARYLSGLEDVAYYVADVAFADKFVGKSLSQPKTFQGKLEPGQTLQQFVYNLSTKYANRVLLQHQALRPESRGDEGRDDYVMMEYNRLRNGALVGFEMIGARATNSYTGTLRVALMNGFDRGAQFVQLYNQDAIDYPSSVAFGNNFLRNQPQDQNAPNTVQVISAVAGPSPGDLKINFTAPGDDWDSASGTYSGAVKSYRVRYLAGTRFVNFVDGTVYAQTWVPTRTGREEGKGDAIGYPNPYVYEKIISLGPAESGKPYCVGIKAVDDADNIGGLHGPLRNHEVAWSASWSTC